MSKKDVKTKCGFVSVIGLPNAGKSTLINAMVGAKVSIVSHKIQTTRSRILGIALHKDAQIILVDTPGIFTPNKVMEKAMVKAAWDSVPDADIVLHIIDAARRDAIKHNEDIIAGLPKHKKSILVLNKTDLVDKKALLPMAKELNDRHEYAETFMISAHTEKGIETVEDYLADSLPKSPFLYDPDQISDLPLRMMAAEITREKIYNYLHQELPYATMVHTEEWENFQNGDVKIRQVITVQKASQKGIVLGKGGAQIKRIGEDSRKELEHLLERRVHLKLFVKVQKDWAERSDMLGLMGLTT